MRQARSLREESNMLGATVGKEKTMPKIDSAAAAQRVFHRLIHQIPILGMNPFQSHVKRDFRRRIIFEDSVGFIRPDNFVSFSFPPKATCVAESLGFGHIDFSAAEFLSQEFLLLNVYADTDSLRGAVVDDQGATHTPNVPDLTVWSNDALGDIKSRNVERHPLH